MADISDIPTVWVFNGAKARFPSAIFSTKDLAVRWITKHCLSGMLTQYPVDMSAYDWALGKGYFTPTKNDHQSPEFIGKFTTGSQEHYHYENGVEGA